ncbi:hypothetical protein [Aeromonas sp.]|uniref:hypothetical protein n=1 Tax=Aeromonas sp. TaxID=647 RepID=UPI00258F8310|nr:hypothetical protein [Aeromonas sp.]MCX7132276.1 hypothetical protein [Aeromonas sp.]
MANVVVCSKMVHGTVFDVQGKQVTIHGQNSDQLVAVKGYAGTCGLTHMPQETWDAITKQYGEMTAIKEGFIFIEKNEEAARKSSDEKKGTKTGQEQAEVKESEKEQ